MYRICCITPLLIGYVSARISRFSEDFMLERFHQGKT